MGLKEYAMMLALIHEYNPFFVLELGMINPVADLLQGFTTVAAHAMNSGCPCSEAEILVRRNMMDDATEREYVKAINEKQVQLFIQGKMPVVPGKSSNSYVREEFGLPEDKFLMAVVGNRLDDEMNKEFISVISGILRKEPTAALVIIGEVENVKRELEGTEFKERVFFLGYCWDLIGVYEILDLYVNPKRSGGGWSGAMALQGGIPVVTLPNCDVANAVGLEFVVQDYQKMETEVHRYITDKAFYEERRECAKKKAKGNSYEKLVDYITNEIDKIIDMIEKKEK